MRTNFKRFPGVMFLVVLSASGVIAMASAAGNGVEPGRRGSIDAELRELDTKRSLAEQELSQLPQRVDAETARIMKSLDGLFRDGLQHDFAEHYQAVEAAVINVGLPADVGALRAFWEQLKSPVSSHGLESLAGDFVAQAQLQTDRGREALQERIGKEVQRVLENELAVAQSEIRQAIQKVVGRHFPVWHHVPFPPPSLPSVETQVVAPGTVNPAVSLVAGILLIVLRKLIRKIVLKISAKISGKVVAKLIPVIGVILLAMTVWDAVRAKAQLEAEFRATFLQVYREEFTPKTVWEADLDGANPSLRRTMETQIRQQLQTWEQHCRAEAYRMLDAARAVSVIPDVRDYLEAQQAKGRDTREVAEELARLDSAFGKLLAEASINDFFAILVDWPGTDHAILRQLADELGTDLLKSYQRHGRPILVAAHRIGPRLFIEILNFSENIDWREVSEALQDYGPLLQTERQKRGVLLLLECKIDHRGIRPEVLEEIGRSPELFRFAANTISGDRQALFQLFGDQKTVAVFRAVHAEDARLAEGFLQYWPVAAWHRYYQNEDRLKALLSVARYRAEERRGSRADFARELANQDELTPIYMDVGLEGLRIRDALVQPDSGAYQRELFKKAIALYKQGFPANRLMDPQEVQIAWHFSHWPVFGIPFTEWAQRLGSMAYLLVYGSVVSLFFLVVLPLLRLIARLMWPRPIGKKRS